MSDEIQLSFEMRLNTGAEETEKTVTHLTDIRRNKGRTAKSDSLPYNIPFEAKLLFPFAVHFRNQHSPTIEKCEF